MKAMTLLKNERVKILKKAASKKREESVKLALSAIDEMVKNGLPITFSAVAKLAGLSTVYLYKHPTLSVKIKTLRQQNHIHNLKNNLYQKLEEQRKTIKELKDQILSKNFEIKRLKKQLETVYGELYRKS